MPACGLQGWLAWVCAAGLQEAGREPSASAPVLPMLVCQESLRPEWEAR